MTDSSFGVTESKHRSHLNEIINNTGFIVLTAIIQRPCQSWGRWFFSASSERPVVGRAIQPYLINRFFIIFVRIKRFEEEMTEIKINGTGDLQRAAKVFLEHIGKSRIIAFYGGMGAGKTTFITAICNLLGVEDVVNSPTFTIVNEYASADGKAVYHFDFYRINRLSEAMDIGLYEYFDSDGLCLIEWPEMIEELLPEETLKVNILVEDEQTRTLLF